MLAQVSIAAATAVVGYDLLGSSTFRQTTQGRVVRRAGLTGSAAALDTQIDLFAGSTKIGSLYNSATGAAQQDASMFTIQTALPANVSLSALVVDAPATNPVNLVIEF